jgi:hypothetical protein
MPGTGWQRFAHNWLFTRLMDLTAAPALGDAASTVLFSSS